MWPPGQHLINAACLLCLGDGLPEECYLVEIALHVEEVAIIHLAVAAALLRMPLQSCFNTEKRRAGPSMLDCFPKRPDTWVTENAKQTAQFPEDKIMADSGGCVPKL